MKRLLISSIAAMALTSSVVVAEESGAFVGLDLGTTGLSLDSKASIAGVSQKSSSSGTGSNVGLVGGYKQFFTDSFGLRYYANLGYLNLTSSVKETGAATQTQSLDAINYGVNVDALYNFVSSDGMDFGAFLGLGLGANTWSGKALYTGKEMAKQANKSLSTTGFDLALNAGLRGVAKQHGVEIAVRVPFMGTKTKIVDGNVDLGIPGIGDTMKVEGTITRNYNAGVRYTFSF